MDGFEDIIKEFLVESYESLDQLDGDLLALEDSPNDRERLENIFRTVHTIKGTSGFLALPKLELVSHTAENLLVPLRDGELALDRPIADVLLETVDAIRAILRHVESGQGEGDQDYDCLVQRLQAALDGTLTCDTSDQGRCEDAVVTASNHEGPAVAEQPHHSIAESSVRINVQLLDQLMNLVGELVLARNQIVQFDASFDDPSMLAASQRLNQITTELQERVMKTRMRPISNAWNPLPRLVRDLASSCGKSVNVYTEGEGTELDKTILEAIKDPLTHIVRNSVDHGIETPKIRAASGKNPDGKMTLRAYHEGGLVVIEIEDDGAGIDPKNVVGKALEKGIVTSQEASTMTESESINLILLPGFSTAAAVTNVSGRGVGMDVVKTNIEAIGGSVDIHSVVGKGTTLRLKIPLTLAIVPALLVNTAGDQYAIPQVSLLELVRVDATRAMRDVEFIHDTPVFRLRDRLLPMVYLDEQLGIRKPRRHNDPNTAINIVVLQAEDQQFGLVVDEITDTQEIVVKPLAGRLREIPVYAGATIMGDGSVSLVLDVIGLAQQGGVLREPSQRAARGNINDEAHKASPVESLLMIDRDDQRRAAIRLSSVARLEKFDVSDIEWFENSAVVQYRGQIMPLASLDEDLVERLDLAVDSQTAQTQPLHTVVYRDGDQSLGVVVGRIVDIVHEQQTTLDQASETRQLVVGGRVTELVDLREFAHSVWSRHDDPWPAT